MFIVAIIVNKTDRADSGSDQQHQQESHTANVLAR
jgi:hypothetical protein